MINVDLWQVQYLNSECLNPNCKYQWIHISCDEQLSKMTAEEIDKYDYYCRECQVQQSSHIQLNNGNADSQPHPDSNEQDEHIIQTITQIVEVSEYSNQELNSNVIPS